MAGGGAGIAITVLNHTNAHVRKQKRCKFSDTKVHL